MSDTQTNLVTEITGGQCPSCGTYGDRTKVTAVARFYYCDECGQGWAER